MDKNFKPSSKFAWIIAGSANYIPALKAFFNSLKVHGHSDDVIIIAFRHPPEFIKWMKTLPFRVEIIEINEGDQIRLTAIERFKLAVDYGPFYKAVCLMDADMFLTANCNLFFEIASKGFIMTGSNGMVINFNAAYQKQYEIDLGKPEWVYTKIHTSSPIFLSPIDLDWFNTLYKARRVNYWDDFLYLNILGIKLGKDKRMLPMPPYMFTGIHHFGVKPGTGWFKKAGTILTGTEEQCYMIHGKWWDKAWRKDLMKIMHGYFKDNHMGPKCVQMTENSIELAYSEFLKYNKM